MNKWRPFNASNAPDTCLWCGTKLRHKPVYAPREKPTDNFVKVGTDPLGGDYQDGCFCGLRCAYQFGVAMAGHGRRLKPLSE